MTFPDFTTVVGVDAIHLEQLQLVWPTWRKHKPDLLKHPMVIFFDPCQVSYADARCATDHPDVRVYPWSVQDYDGGDDKWTNPQRYKMLAGHVYVPARLVQTEYWLKIDTDTVATGCPEWIDPGWFASEPAIISQPWGYTKPADQIQQLDNWADEFRFALFPKPPLDLPVEPGGSLVRHPRIISWIGFFRTAPFGIDAAKWASLSCGYGKLPVRSQDGYHWYYATRMGWEIQRHDFKRRGWEHHSRLRTIRESVRRAME